MDNLAKRLDAFVARYPNGAFVRLSTRSPKDAVLLSPKLYENLEKLIDESNEDPNACVTCIFESKIIIIIIIKTVP